MSRTHEPRSLRPLGLALLASFAFNPTIAAAQGSGEIMSLDAAESLRGTFNYVEQLMRSCGEVSGNPIAYDIHFGTWSDRNAEARRMLDAVLVHHGAEPGPGPTNPYDKAAVDMQLSGDETYCLMFTLGIEEGRTDISVVEPELHEQLIASDRIISEAKP